MTDTLQRLAGLLETLAVSRADDDVGGRWDTLLALTHSLIGALADPRITVFQFIATARIFRAVRSGPADESTLGTFRRWLAEGSQRELSGVPACIANLFSEVERVGASDAARLCRGAGPATRRLVMEHTGQTLPQVRRALVVRRMLPSLTITDEHVRQIAFHVGYTHASQCDRDFHWLLRVSPKEFRRLFRRGGSYR